MKVLLRGVREFFDCHDKPFLNATPISGQAHTFKSPTTRLKERFSVTVKQNAFFYSCASKVGTSGNSIPVPPLGLHEPGPLAELFGMVFYLWWLPRQLFRQPLAPQA